MLRKLKVCYSLEEEAGGCCSRINGHANGWDARDAEGQERDG